MTKRFGVITIDKHGSAAGGVAAINIAPAIANQKTLGQIDIERFRGAQDHPRLGLAAVARIRPLSTGVPAYFYARNLWQGIQHFPMDRIHSSPCLRPARDIRLVCYDDEEVAGRFEAGAASRHFFVKLKVFSLRRRVRSAFADHRFVDNTIAVEKDRRQSYFVLSHFVCVTFSFGWLTNRCHNTAWNASACGVVLFGFTVGITITISATFAV